MGTQKNKNANLHKAKKDKNDEFYTQLSDIENELKHYKKHFNDKTVMLPCDDPMESFFTIYFLQHFNELGIKRLICTCYKGSKIAFTEYSLFDYLDELEGKRNEDESIENNGYVMDIKKVPNQINETEVKKLLKKKGIVKKLKGDGDFRSKEVKEYLKQADIVVTNPPFSLWREFVAELIEYDKKFLILGSQNAITYKEIFVLIRNNKMWLGYGSNMSLVYKTPYKNELEANADYVRQKGYNPEEGYVKVPACSWFTNLDIDKRHEEIDLFKTYKGHEEDYPKYDNYDAINIDKVSDIPQDYNGVMGVPITFLDKHCPEQFKIIGLLQSSSDEQAGIPNLRKYNDFEEMTQKMEYTGASGGKANGNPVLKGKSEKGNFLYNKTTKEYVHSVYARITIKKIIEKE